MEQKKLIEQPKVFQIWTTKTITTKEWGDYFKWQPHYCVLSSEGVGRSKMMKIGFMCASYDKNYIPPYCERMTEDEMITMDLFLKAKNHSPTPLIKVEKEVYNEDKNLSDRIENGFKITEQPKTELQKMIDEIPEEDFPEISKIEKEETFTEKEKEECNDFWEKVDGKSVF